MDPADNEEHDNSQGDNGLAASPVQHSSPVPIPLPQALADDGEGFQQKKRQSPPVLSGQFRNLGSF